MKSTVIACALVVALTASTTQAAPDAPPVSRTTALSASVDDLARSALQAAAPRFVEVERPSFTGLAGPGAPLQGLRFATAAEPASYPGLCKATTAWVSLVEGSPPLATKTVYKVVGDLNPPPNRSSEPYGAELSRKCAAAGRVLPTDTGDFGRATFFEITAGGEHQVWRNARALEVAIAAAKAGGAVACKPLPEAEMEAAEQMDPQEPEAIEARENRKACAEPAALLANLSLGKLTELTASPCPDAPRSNCVSALFLRHAFYNRQAHWSVTLRYQKGDGRDRDVKTVTAVKLEPSWAIYD